ncbi:MAG: hypothetical protein WDA65_03725 [Christensenellales bacterium]
MKEIMRSHIKRYPKMRLSDMVKLLYQSEFAGSRESAHKLVSVERECLSASPCAAGVFEDIGGGLCRLHLYNAKQMEIGMDTVSRLFLATANAVNGNIVNLEKKMNLLHECIKNKLLPFDFNLFKEYTGNLRENGWPALRHSEQYRAAYRPSYRVVKKEYCVYIKAIAAIDKLLDKKQRVTVAIEGRSGAGKSTLAAYLREVYDNCGLFHMDDFFLPSNRRTKERLSQPGGNIDYERFGDEVLSGIGGETPFCYRAYNCKQDALGAPIYACPSRINIVEGVYSMHPALQGSYDYTVFLDIDVKTQSERIKKRSGESLHKRFTEEWIPLEELYFSAFNIKNRCDIVYP